MADTELDSIINQLELVFDKDPWYGKSMVSILESVNQKWVYKAPVKGVHSIAELLEHIITWRELAEKRLDGDNKFAPDQEASFNWKKRFPKKATAWEYLLKEFAAGHQKLIAQLRQKDDSLLDEPVEGRPYTYRHLLNGITHHYLYHIGQISLINRMMQEKYQPESGILRYGYRVFPFDGMSRMK